jgi:hypothetical protein
MKVPIANLSSTCQELVALTKLAILTVWPPVDAGGAAKELRLGPDGVIEVRLALEFIGVKRDIL